MRGIILLILIFLFGPGFSQSFEAWSNQMKEDFDGKLAAVDKSLDIRFVLNTKTLQPEAEIYYRYEYENIKGVNFSEYFYIFHNDQIEVKNVKLNEKNVHAYYRDVSDYNGEGIFHSDSKVTSFDNYFNKLAERVIVEYTLRVKDVKYVTNYFFHDDYPSYNTTITLNIPEWIDVRIEEINFSKADITKQTTSSKDFANIYIYQTKMLDAWHDEQATDGPTYIYPHLLLLPKHFTIKNETYKLFESVADLYGWYRTLVADIGNENETLKPLVKKLVEGKTTDLEKIEAIYYWVQDNIRYIAFEDGIAGFKPDACQNVLENKYGDCKGMANLAAEMLKIAGYDARLTWLGTRRIAYDYSYPSLSTDNHMICTVLINGETYFLDPTEKFTALGENATRIQEQEALIQDGDKYILKRIPVRNHVQNNYKSEVRLTLNEDQQLIGKGNYQATGECKTSLLNLIDKTEKEKLDLNLSKHLGNYNKNNIVKNLQFNNIADRSKPLDVEFDIAVDHAITALGNEWYVELDPFKEYANSKIDKDRNFDYLHDNRRVELLNIELEIPNGYTLKYLPKPFEVQNEEFEFKINYTQNGNLVSYERHINFPSIKISKTNFEKWNAAIAALKSQYKEQIILEKQ
jgi:transglutaminase-like putative cysteine protease